MNKWATYMIAVGLSTNVISVVETVEQEVEDIYHSRFDGFSLVDRDDGDVSARKP